MTDEAAFLAAIAAAPNDVSPRLVFADWLDERDDPRGWWFRDPNLYALVGVRGENPTPKLIKRLLTPTPGAGLVETCVLIGRVGQPAVEPLLNALRKSTRPGFLLAGLASLRDQLPSFAPRLVNEAVSDDPATRRAALQVLEHFPQPMTLDDLRRLLGSPYPDTVRRGIIAAGRLGEEAAPLVPEILRIGRTKYDDSVGLLFRMVAIDALHDIGDLGAVPYLAECLADPGIARSAAYALASFDKNSLDPAVRKAVARVRSPRRE